ncbi:predicted protein [Lichtheimia corymbifera JMRC:FSU:9682]|uniref:Uncharacterized protein n=1 Tax=Lichtheimia corymbifera JMRC:FSU:9682 TaxID=1263082 RepID=A0A068RYH6_9FUNG|nr:predicted protein [Lichtheimia corymbifera JMRC:FSU:9682]
MPVSLKITMNLGSLLEQSCVRNVTTSLVEKNSRGRVWLVGDIVRFRIGQLDRETSTQGALEHDEQLCSIEESKLHYNV